MAQGFLRAIGSQICFLASFACLSHPAACAGEPPEGPKPSIAWQGCTAAEYLEQLTAPAPAVPSAEYDPAVGDGDTDQDGIPDVPAATVKFDDFTWQTLAQPPGGLNEDRTYTCKDIHQLLTIRGAETNYYGYDAAGNMTQFVKNGVTNTFGYDRLNRQVSAVMSVGLPSQTSSSYAYYGAGWMRQNMTVAPASPPAVPPASPPATTLFAHDSFACVAAQTGGGWTHYAVPSQTPLWEAFGPQAGSPSQSYALDYAGWLRQ